MDISRINNINKSKATEKEEINNKKQKEDVSVFGKINRGVNNENDESKIESILKEMESYANGYLREQEENEIKAYSTQKDENNKSDDYEKELSSLYMQLSKATEKEERYALEDRIGELQFQREFSDLSKEIKSGNLSPEERDKISAEMEALENRYMLELKEKKENRFNDEINEMYEELENSFDPEERQEIKEQIREMEFSFEMEKLQEKIEETDNPQMKESLTAKMKALQYEFESESSQIRNENNTDKISDMYYKLAHSTDEYERDKLKAQITQMTNEIYAENEQSSGNKELSELYKKLSMSTETSEQEKIKAEIAKLTNEQ